MTSVYESMIRELGDYNTGQPDGPAVVEVIERNAPGGRLYILRIAFQHDSEVKEIIFHSREQLKDLVISLMKYVDGPGIFAALAAPQRPNLF